MPLTHLLRVEQVNALSGLQHHQIASHDGIGEAVLDDLAGMCAEGKSAALHGVVH